jgi:hypothetical protein
MGLLYGRAWRLTAKNGGFRRGQKGHFWDLGSRVETYLAQMPLQSFPPGWTKDPWALHPVTLRPMIWEFVLRDVALAKHRHPFPHASRDADSWSEFYVSGTKIGTRKVGHPRGLYLPGGIYRAVPGDIADYADWFDLHCDALDDHFGIDPRNFMTGAGQVILQHFQVADVVADRTDAWRDSSLLAPPTRWGGFASRAGRAPC